MIRKVGKYEISTDNNPVTISNYWYRIFTVYQNDKSIMIRIPSFETAITLYYSEDEESIDYCLAKYRAEASNWLNQIDTFLGIN